MKRTGLARKSRMKRGTAPLARSARLTTRTPIRARNAARQSSEFVRTYHSKRRKRWIAAHPCLVCGSIPSVNAHTRHPSSGAGYKGNYVAIVPICGVHEREKHRIGEDTFNAKYARELLGRTLASWAETVAHAWTLIGSEVAA